MGKPVAPIEAYVPGRPYASPLRMETPEAGAGLCPSASGTADQRAGLCGLGAGPAYGPAPACRIELPLYFGRACAPKGDLIREHCCLVVWNRAPYGGHDRPPPLSGGGAAGGRYWWRRTPYGGCGRPPPQRGGGEPLCGPRGALGGCLAILLRLQLHWEFNL